MERIATLLGLLLLYGCTQVTEDTPAPVTDTPQYTWTPPEPAGPPIYEKALIIEYNQSMKGTIYAPKNLVMNLIHGDIQLLWRCIKGNDSLYLSYYQRFGIGHSRQHNENGQPMHLANVTYAPSRYGFLYPAIPEYRCNPLGFDASPPVPLPE